MVSKDSEEYNKIELSKLFKKYQTQLKDITLDNWKSYVYNVLSCLSLVTCTQYLICLQKFFQQELRLLYYSLKKVSRLKRFGIIN